MGRIIPGKFVICTPNADVISIVFTVFFVDVNFNLSTLAANSFIHDTTNVGIHLKFLFVWILTWIIDYKSDAKLVCRLIIMGLQ